MISLPRLLIRFRYWRAHRHQPDVFVNVWDIHRKRQMTEAEFQQQLDREGKILRRSQSVLRWQR
jgi:predicted GTPase